MCDYHSFQPAPEPRDPAELLAEKKRREEENRKKHTGIEFMNDVMR